MMTEIRDIDSHLLFRGDAEIGMLVRENKREKIEIFLPRGGQVRFSGKGTFSEITRTEYGYFYVDSRHCSF